MFIAITDGDAELRIFLDNNSYSINNFDEIYSLNGWTVSMDRPAYNEFYDTSWTFKERKDDPYRNQR